VINPATSYASRRIAWEDFWCAPHNTTSRFTCAIGLRLFHSVVRSFHLAYIDFSLVIFETLRQMESNPQIKARLSQIQYLVVDEYQDINNLQEKFCVNFARKSTSWMMRRKTLMRAE
jgi:superfamily I DNA/RNA helicase